MPFLHRVTKFIALILATSSLSGCFFSTFDDTESTYTPSISWEVRQNRLATLDHWQIKARAASADDIFGFSGDITWAQRGNQFDLAGAGPLGIGAFRAKGTPQRVTLKTQQGVQVSQNPAADMQRLLGWRVPLSALRYWALGLPYQQNFATADTNRFNTVFDGNGRLLQLQQAGWTMTYQRYDFQPAFNIDLPTRLLIEDDNGSYRIKMLIETWQPIDALKKRSITSNLPTIPNDAVTRTDRVVKVGRTNTTSNTQAVSSNSSHDHTHQHAKKQQEAIPKTINPPPNPTAKPRFKSRPY